MRLFPRKRAAQRPEVFSISVSAYLGVLGSSQEITGFKIDCASAEKRETVRQQVMAAHARELPMDGICKPGARHWTLVFYWGVSDPGEAVKFMEDLQFRITGVRMKLPRAC